MVGCTRKSCSLDCRLVMSLLRLYAASVQQIDTQHMFCNMRAAGYGTMTDVAHPLNEPSVCYVCFHTGGVVMM